MNDTNYLEQLAHHKTVTPRLTDKHAVVKVILLFHDNSSRDTSDISTITRPNYIHYTNQFRKPAGDSCKVTVKRYIMYKQEHVCVEIGRAHV